MGRPVDSKVLDLVSLRNGIEDDIKRLRDEKARVEAQIAALLREDTGTDTFSFRYGDWVVRVGPEYRIAPRPETQRQLFKWLQSYGDLQQLARFDSLRIGQVKQLADLMFREVDEDTGEVYEGWAGMKARYFDESEGDTTKLTMMPLDRAPKFIQDLPEGEGITR